MKYVGNNIQLPWANMRSQGWSPNEQRLRLEKVEIGYGYLKKVENSSGYLVPYKKMTWIDIIAIEYSQLRKAAIIEGRSCYCIIPTSSRLIVCCTPSVVSCYVMVHTTCIDAHMHKHCVEHVKLIYWYWYFYCVGHDSSNFQGYENHDGANYSSSRWSEETVEEPSNVPTNNRKFFNSGLSETVQ